MSLQAFASLDAAYARLDHARAARPAPDFTLAEELRALDAQLAEEIKRAGADDRHRLFLVKLGVQLRSLADQAAGAEREAILLHHGAAR